MSTSETDIEHKTAAQMVETFEKWDNELIKKYPLADVQEVYDNLMLLTRPGRTKGVTKSTFDFFYSLSHSQNMKIKFYVDCYY